MSGSDRLEAQDNAHAMGGGGGCIAAMVFDSRGKVGVGRENEKMEARGTRN